MTSRLTIVSLLSGLSLSGGGTFGRRRKLRRFGSGCQIPMRRIIWSPQYDVAGQKLCRYLSTVIFRMRRKRRISWWRSNVRILAPLPTKFPYFQHESHGGSGPIVERRQRRLITLESKWGRRCFPGGILRGAVKRITSLLDKVSELLRPKFRAEAETGGLQRQLRFHF